MLKNSWPLTGLAIALFGFGAGAAVDAQDAPSANASAIEKENVIETGIYNLTKDEAPALVHFGKDRTEQWLLVRVKQDEQQDQQQNQQSSQNN